MVSQAEDMAKLMDKCPYTGRHICARPQFVAARITVDFHSVKFQSDAISLLQIIGVRPHIIGSSSICLSIAGIIEVDIIHISVAIGVIA